MVDVHKALASLLALLLAVGAGAAGAADERLCIVVPNGSSHRIENPEILAAIYRLKKRYWSDGSRIEPVNLPATDPRRQRFSQFVLGVKPEQLEAYWNQMYFHGLLPPHVLASTEAVLRFVASTPGAIGYVPLCDADARVTMLLAIDIHGRFIAHPSRDGCKP